MPPKKKKTATGYNMPEHLDEGTVLTDITKKQWKLGKSIGTGGFGEIYLAKEVGGKGMECVVKIEPHENGPLFVEMHYYLNAGKPEQVTGWCKGRGKDMGGSPHVPLLRGHGSYMHKGTDNYRFLVIDRLGSDLEKTFNGGKNPLSLGTASSLASQVLTSLEYIHSRGYTHNDVKAANLLVGAQPGSQEVFLVDFGLAVKYLKGGTDHKPQAPDPRKAHDGTIEYLSRDAHLGCTSRRSDLEVLAACLVHWTTGKLDWVSNLTPDKVQTAKVKWWEGKMYMGLGGPVELYCKYVAGLGFEEEPNYQKCREMFAGEVKKMGGRLGLGETQTNGHTISPKNKVAVKKGAKKTPVAEDESPEEDSAVDDSPQPVKKTRKPVTKKPVVKTVKNTTKNSKTTQMSDSDEDMFTDPPPAKPIKPRYAEAASQTSPAFVAASKARRAGLKALARAEALANGDEAIPATPGRSKGGATGLTNLLQIDDKVESPVTPDRRRRGTPVRAAASSPAPSKVSSPAPSKVSSPAPSIAASLSEGLPDNPTPAMLAIIQRRQQAAEEKANKKRKTPAAGGSTPGAKKKTKA